MICMRPHRANDRVRTQEMVCELLGGPHRVDVQSVQKHFFAYHELRC
jgi:hypothetical protein